MEICGIGGGYAGICGDRWGICGDMWRYAEICGDMRRYVEICGTDHLPEIGPAGLPFFGPPPPTYINYKTGTANYQLDEKRMFIFRLTC